MFVNVVGGIHYHFYTAVRSVKSCMASGMARGQLVLTAETREDIQNSNSSPKKKKMPHRLSQESLV
jgi:uncharacterized protein YoaH (UPF0181 family)